MCRMCSYVHCAHAMPHASCTTTGLSIVLLQQTVSDQRIFHCVSFQDRYSAAGLPSALKVCMLPHQIATCAQVGSCLALLQHFLLGPISNFWAMLLLCYTWCKGLLIPALLLWYAGVWGGMGCFVRRVRTCRQVRLGGLTRFYTWRIHATVDGGSCCLLGVPFPIFFASKEPIRELSELPLQPEPQL